MFSLLFIYVLAITHFLSFIQKQLYFLLGIFSRQKYQETFVSSVSVQTEEP